jgi:iron complex transport system substrate-binding protein
MLKNQETEQAMDKWKEWPGIPAIRDARTFVVDADLFNRPSPRLVEALEILSQLIHPEITLNSRGFQSSK